MARLAAILLACVIAAPATSVAVPARTARGHSDPYANFHYQVVFDGRVVAGFSVAHDLRATPVGRHAGLTLSLEKGMTRDGAFEAWANSLLKPGGGDATINIPRRDIVINAMDETGKVKLAYNGKGCIATAFQALPDLDANGNALAIALLKLECLAMALP